MASTEVAVRKTVTSVPTALKALAAMERQLTNAKTYAEIRKIIQEAGALKVLLADVAEVKAAAEDTILLANKRISIELQKIPKATNKTRPPKVTRKVKFVYRGPVKPEIPPGRGKVSGMGRQQRSMLNKLGRKTDTEIKTLAADLRSKGKDASVSAVLLHLTQVDSKKRRELRERELGAKQFALPNKQYGVIVADPEWRWEPWSRETGMDRAADNHYPTSCTEIIAARDVPSISAKDCVLFLWATNPMLPHALLVMAAWDFNYVSNYCWGKDKIGPGYWSREKHELLLIGTRGNIPCPSPGTQLDSLLMAPRGSHSAKPEIFLEMIEGYFPHLPKIELNRRGPARPGWDAWGNEAETMEAAQ